MSISVNMNTMNRTLMIFTLSDQAKGTNNATDKNGGRNVIRRFTISPTPFASLCVGLPLRSFGFARCAGQVFEWPNWRQRLPPHCCGWLLLLVFQSLCGGRLPRRLCRKAERRTISTPCFSNPGQEVTSLLWPCPGASQSRP